MADVRDAADGGERVTGGPERRPRWWSRPRWPRTRRGQRRALWAAAALCVLALAAPTWMNVTAAPRVRSGEELGSVARAPVAMVFGAGLWDGVPSPYLAHRLDTAARLYERGTVGVLLVTGDNSSRGYDEPDAMRRYLVDHGVPADRVVPDYAGFDTWDSCARARRVFGVHHAVLVSQGFHIRRAVALCEAAGVTSQGVAVDEKHDVTWYYGGVRELFAADKAALDALLRPDPRFLGPREDGVARALGSGSGAAARR